MSLTLGAVEGIYNGVSLDDPVVQVLDLKKLESKHGAANLKYRVVLSDGAHYVQGILATQVCGMAESGEIAKFCCVRLKNYACNSLQNRRIVIVLSLEVVNSHTSTIGSPMNIEGSSGNVQQPAPAAPEPKPQYPPPAPQGVAVAAPVAQRTMAPLPTYSTAERGSVKVQPISSLNIYQQHWTIRGRVSNKGGIRHYNNQKGAGKLSSFELVDEDKGEIRLTMFNDTVDRLGDLIEVGKVYTVSRGQVKHANKRFSSLNSDYEITLNEQSVVDLVSDDQSIPQMVYRFVSIGDLRSLPDDSIVDAKGVIVSVSDVVEFQSKAGRQLQKRTLTLVDESTFKVDLTLWGDDAVSFPGNPGSIIACKGVRVSSFNSRSLTLPMQSFYVLEPQIDEAYSLRTWYDQQSSSYIESAQSISVSGGMAGEGGSGSGGSAEVMTIAQMQEQNLGFGLKPDYVTVQGIITQIRHEKDIWYSAKRVGETDGGNPRYEKCEPDDPEAEKRYVMSCIIGDGTSSTWITVFDKMVMQMLGDVSANDLAMYKEVDLDHYKMIMDDALFKEYTLRLRVKVETMRDEQRARSVVVSVSPVDYEQASRRLIDEIKNLMV